jgi:hypothetical protein
MLSSTVNFCLESVAVGRPGRLRADAELGVYLYSGGAEEFGRRCLRDKEITGDLGGRMSTAAAAAASSCTAVVNPFVSSVGPCVVSGLTGPHLICRSIKHGHVTSGTPFDEKKV